MLKYIRNSFFIYERMEISLWDHHNHWCFNEKKRTRQEGGRSDMEEGVNMKRRSNDDDEHYFFFFLPLFFDHMVL